MDTKYIPVIGLEIHVELGTRSKLFCGCSSDHFAKKPNTQTCPVCLGLPGALPIANKTAIDSTIAIGLAFNSKINSFSKFDRKHYFYPDLPKGFQISQYDIPFCEGGYLDLSTGKRINLRRVHLEEDTAKIVHEGNDSLLDFNRSSVPLVELVTEPDFHHPSECVEFAKEFQLIVRSLGVSTADMEKGSLRLEANISMTTDISLPLPEYKVELKNINSFKFMEKALLAEIERQSIALEKGEKLIQETRGFNEQTGLTFTQREKEEAKDYRYFPEPDLPPIRIDENDIERIKISLPELPSAKRKRFSADYQLPGSYTEILVQDDELGNYFEKAVKADEGNLLGSKTIADVIINKNMHKDFPEPQGLIAKLISLSKRDFATSEEVESAIAQVVSSEPDAVAQYKAGKTQIIRFFVGSVQKILKGNGDPKLIIEKLTAQLQR